MIRLCFKHQYLEHENRDDTAAKQIRDHVISLCENDPYIIELAINGKKKKRPNQIGACLENWIGDRLAGSKEGKQLLENWL